MNQELRRKVSKILSFGGVPPSTGHAQKQNPLQVLASGFLPEVWALKRTKPGLFHE